MFRVCPTVEHLYPLGEFAVTRLFNLPADEVSRFELAEMDLIAAYGLSGTTGMDIGALLTQVDDWAKRIAEFTLKNTALFHKNRAAFGTLARYRMTAMLQALTREFGVRYNPDRIADPQVWTDPADSFIHGVLGPRRTGTCSSLPVLLTALGRRLGYPLHLVLSPGHVFCRWDSPEERFNIEYNERGLNSHPDRHYQEWPMPWPRALHEQERQRPSYLISLSPPEELALIAATRAHCLDAADRRNEAVATMAVAYRLSRFHAHGVWVTHLSTKAMFPDRTFPGLPCEETAGPAALKRIEAARSDHYSRFTWTTTTN